MYTVPRIKALYDGDNNLYFRREYNNIEGLNKLHTDKCVSLSISNVETKSPVPDIILNFKDLESLYIYKTYYNKIPDDIWKLHKLKYIVWSDNNYLSSLPKAFSCLVNLEQIDISNNSIKILGDFMNELKMPNLKIIIAQKNGMRKLDDCLEYLPKLEKLNLNCNRLSSLPESFGSLSNLKELILTGNLLTNLPDSFCKLSKLETLYLDCNKLESLPNQFGNLENLQFLTLRKNNLQQLPYSFGELSKLIKLYIYDNQLIKLPDSFCNLKELEILNLNNNKLELLPNNFGKLSKLNSLDISLNNIVSIPDSFGKLIKLWHLDMNNNKIKELPKCIRNLYRLTDFDICYNRLNTLGLSLLYCRNLKNFYYYHHTFKDTDLPIQITRFINRLRNTESNKNIMYNYDSNIQPCIFDTIENLHNNVKTKLNGRTLYEGIINDEILTDICKYVLLKHIRNKDVDSLLLLNFAEIFWLVWNIIKEIKYNDREIIKSRLNNEFIEYEYLSANDFCYKLFKCLRGFSNLLEL
jgi:Leucine-rich repeat (LRR) protein